MAKLQKYIFLQALIITLVVFNVGIFLGYKLESSRVDKINNWYIESDLDVIDQKIQNDLFDFIEPDCDLITEKNIEFADKIYADALKINEYENANRISNEIVLQHKRFDLLRTIFWINSIKIKNRCNSDYHIVVYFYQYNNPSIEQKAKQKFFSNLLAEVKQEKGNSIMLIPIAGDNNLPSVDLLLEEYDIKEFPTILIDESAKISEVNDINDVLKYLD